MAQSKLAYSLDYAGSKNVEFFLFWTLKTILPFQVFWKGFRVIGKNRLLYVHDCVDNFKIDFRSCFQERNIKKKEQYMRKTQEMNHSNRRQTKITEYINNSLRSRVLYMYLYKCCAGFKCFFSYK